MHNRPVNLRNWGSDPGREPYGSALRLLAIFGVFLLAAVVICVRAAWLQTAARERYLSRWDRTYERIEPIPARNGRVLTADGQLLAFDDPRYSVSVHYRWFEEPPDERWLASQAAARLSPRERRQSERVESARRQVLTERSSMHADLAAALNVTPQALQGKFSEVQSKIERIVASVEERRAQREEEARSQTSRITTVAKETGWRQTWERVKQELTTPPERPQRDPIIVQEELEYHEIVSGASLSAIGRIESFPNRFHGVRIELTTRRIYPQKDQAVHVVGARTPLREEEFEQRAAKYPEGDPLNYQTGDSIGRAGIELAYDGLLHGVWGQRRVETNRQGEILQQELVRPAADGQDVILTIDSRLQKAAEELLDRAVEQGQLPARTVEHLTPDSGGTTTLIPRGASLVAIDVRTGAILAAAAAPRYNAELLLSATPEDWQAVAGDTRRPFFPRVTQAVLPPGSVFKTLTAIAGLEAGIIDPQERFDCQGYLERTDRDRCAVFRHFGVGHGPVTLDDALAQSCNVYFFDVARKLGHGPIDLWAQRFGFGRPTGTELPGEKGGHLPSPERRRAGDEPWYPGTTRQLAVGQAALTVTPLQVARLMAAIANDGWLVTPHFVRDVGNPTHEVPQQQAESTIELASLWEEPKQVQTRRPVRIRGLSPGTLATVRRGMLQAVEHPRGTGREALLNGVRIAGKTGTAEQGGGKPDHAWFAGFAPAESPRIAFVVVLEEGGSGGRAAAPVAREFVRAWAELGMSGVATPRN